MNTERIDFISTYCDRWCERCAFTNRCSTFACTIAVAMCGDIAAGIELAVGAPPHPPPGASRETIGAGWLPEVPNVEPSAAVMAEYRRDEKARRVRLDRAAVNVAAKAYVRRSGAWLKRHRDSVAASADPVVREALDIVAWDAYFVGAKLHRALDSRDRARHGEGESGDRHVQNDWNGSAKVALISLERSELAWRVIGDATGDRSASGLGDVVGNLRRIVLEEFPNAMAFVRPGFDQPWRHD